MTRSVRALIDPTMLRWAREKSGLTLKLAAQKLAEKEEKIKLWENGEKAPTFKQLIKVAKKYKRPVALFYLEEPPKDFKPLNDYRRLPGTPPVSESPQLNYEIRRAHYRRQVALELFEELDEKPYKLTKKISVKDNPEEIGVKIREWLDINTGTQEKWRQDYTAFNGWRQAIEHIGIMVLPAATVPCVVGCH